MNETLHIDNETLVAYLYDEVDAQVRAQVERHLQRCGTCGGEFAALSGVRTALTSWAPPSSDLGFTVVPRSEQVPATVLRPAPWWNTVPLWAQTVAAILVVAVSAGVANVQIRSNPDGFVVTTGWMSPAGAPATPTAPTPSTEAAGDESWKPALMALESQLRNEMRSVRGVDGPPARVAARAVTDDAILKSVQELLAASETRQQRELALRLTQFNQDVNVQRQADLVRIQQLFGHSEGELARQGQMLNYVIRASGKPQQ